MRAFRTVFALIVLATLAACDSGTPVEMPKPLSFSQYPPINLDVASIEFVDEYQPPMRAPNVDHEFRTTPSEAVRQWVKDRVRATGGSRMLQVIIKDASVVEENLPTTQGYRGPFTNDQSERYNARIEVEMRIYGSDSALSEASINVVGTRSDTAAENFSLAQRDALYDRMLRDLMALMNAELERNFQQYFAQYVRYAPEM